MIIADEPTTALDVTIQAQILHLLADIQRETGIGLILISHDLGVVAGIAHRIAVMYGGQIVETGARDPILGAPAASLHRGPDALGSDTRCDEARRHAGFHPGHVPRPTGALSRCGFLDRCPYAQRLRGGPVPWCPRPNGCPLRPAGRRAVAIPGPGRASEGVMTDRAQRAGGHQDLPGRPDVRQAGATLHALRGIDLEVRKGETLGLVGKSGCGKTTLARLILGIEPRRPARWCSETNRSPNWDRLERAQLVQPVFQDPYSSLNPRMRIARIVAAPLEVRGIGTASSRRGARPRRDACGRARPSTSWMPIRASSPAASASASPSRAR